MEIKLCPHCNKPLESEREKYIGCCFVCRRFALLLGRFPREDEIKNQEILKED